MKLSKMLRLAVACSFATGTISHADEEKKSADESVLLSGKTNSILVSVKSVGQFGSPGWKSWITIAKKGKGGSPIHKGQSAHVLQTIELLPVFSKVRFFQGSDVFIVCYLLQVDGLDPDELVWVMIHSDKVYKSTSKVTKPLEEGLNVEPLQTDSSMPPALQKFAEEEWSEIVRAWAK